MNLKGKLKEKDENTRDRNHGSKKKGQLGRRNDLESLGMRRKSLLLEKKMIVDSGCTRTLVNKNFAKNGSLTGEEMSVLTATGEHLIVPLPKVEIGSGQGKHVELVGVLDKLPVDCPLGRSSFGQTLSKESVLKQWERNVSDNDCRINEAFVLTRGHKALLDTQRRADALIDRENSLAVETLSKKETRQHGLKQGDLPTLFGDRKQKKPVMRARYVTRK